MCFSASASFGAGVVLSTIGVASMKKAGSGSQLFFVSIPFIFAFQQITEGFLWLALTHSEWQFLRSPATYNFLFFAQVVWPFWVPFSIYKLEQNATRKKLQRLIVYIGATVSLFLACCLLSLHVEAKVDGLHIQYQQDYPYALSTYGGFLYVVATIVPPFLSSIRQMWSLGLAILISYIITELFYEHYIVSVWCFFASVISAAVLAVIWQLKKESRVNALFYSSHQLQHNE